VSDDFISSFLTHTSEYESPTSFWKWSAITAIGSILRDNCYRQFGDHRIYPNIYTLLVADSAVHRKGNPVKLCEALVSKINNTKVISGRTSIQAILDELSRGETNPKTGALLKGGSALFSAAELSAGIVNDPEAVKILTDIYDFREEYTSRLRGTGTFRIKNVCFSMMAASNASMLIGFFDNIAILGGLLGRTMLVKPDQFRQGNSLWDIKDTSVGFKQLVCQLKVISELKGEFEFSIEAKEVYDNWYIPLRKSYEKKPDSSGILGRIHTSVLKVAMILSVNYRQELQVEKRDIEESIDECMALLPNYQSFIMRSGKSTIADVGAIVLGELIVSKDHQMSRKELLRKHWNQFDAEIFDKTMQTLVPAGMLLESMNGTGIFYQLSEKCLESLTKGTEV
jgi:hypothetical protein